MPDDNSTETPPASAAGRILALDLGTKRIGVAISDERRLTIRPLPVLPRTSWKKLVHAVRELLERFDVKTIVVGLPLRLDGSAGETAAETLRAARNLELSLGVPVHVQDERLTSQAAAEALRAKGLRTARARRAHIDGESAALILRDFLDRLVK